MNLNLLAYALFYPSMVYIAVVVARTCHTHGRVWMMRIFDQEAHFVDAVNNVLLVGCYTVNVGYAALVVATWQPIATVGQLIGTLSERIALILFTLAFLHYTNITVLLVWSHIKHRHTPTHQRHG